MKERTDSRHENESEDRHDSARQRNPARKLRPAPSGPRSSRRGASRSCIDGRLNGFRTDCVKRMGVAGRVAALSFLRRLSRKWSNRLRSGLHVLVIVRLVIHHDL